MDPFVKLKIGTQVFETKVAEDQGKKPVWNEVFEIKYDKTAELQVEVLEKDAKSNDSLGSGKCAL
jgi:Ca2+-dependent lipid-binding protein